MYFLDTPKNTVHGHWTDRRGIRRLTIKKDSYFVNIFIYPDREKNSASNDTIFNGSYTDIKWSFRSKIDFLENELFLDEKIAFLVKNKSFVKKKFLVENLVLEKKKITHYTIDRFILTLIF